MVVGATVVGATVVGGTVVGGTVVGGTVVGATVVGATVVGATVVGATVVGGTVVGATVVGATVVGATVVGATVATGATVVVAMVVDVASANDATRGLMLDACDGASGTTRANPCRGIGSEPVGPAVTNVWSADEPSTPHPEASVTRTTAAIESSDPWRRGDPEANVILGRSTHPRITFRAKNPDSDSCE